MERNITPTPNMNTENIHESTNELQALGSDFSKASFLQKKQEMLTRHAENLADNNKTWLSRMTLTKSDKVLLREYTEKRREALDIIHTNQNKALAAICEGQKAFMKEVVNTLLKTGRAGLKGASDVIFMEYKMQRTLKLERIANDFYDLIEIKMGNAEKRPQPLQAMKMREIEIDLQKWERDYQLLQDEFSNILSEQV